MGRLRLGYFHKMGLDGNIPSCTSGSTKPPKEPEEVKNLVRIGSRYFSKDTKVQRKLNLVLRVEKAPGGVAFGTQNELVSEKSCVYNPVNKKLPTFPGEQLSPVSEETTMDPE